MRTVILVTLAATALTGVSRCGQTQDKKEMEVFGIYGSPAMLWEKGHNLDSLNVNSVFLNWHSINDQMLLRARAEGAKVYAEFPLLNGKGYVDTHPEAWAIDRYGKQVEPATWFMGVCPTDAGFRKHRSDELIALLDTFDLDGIWLDYLHWHAQFEDPHPILPETCFCDNCLKTFGAAAGLDLPDGSTAEKASWIISSHDSLWRDWRCSVIAGWVADMRKIVKEHDPDILLGIYHCPWNDEEFEGARRRILGLDYDMLRELTDVFSPMVYHARMGRAPEWVAENTEWFCSRLDIKPGTFPKVWTIVQAYDEPYIITADEFETVIRGGSVSGSTGVMMFTSRAVAENDEKTERMRRVYRSLKPGSQ